MKIQSIFQRQQLSSIKEMKKILIKELAFHPDFLTLMDFLLEM